MFRYTIYCSYLPSMLLWILTLTSTINNTCTCIFFMLYTHRFYIVFNVILYIYCMLVREIWKCIHPRVSYSPEAIWYSWVNKFSYFLYPHAINVLLYRMKPRKHIYRYVKYCWQTFFKSIATLSQIFKNHIVMVAPESESIRPEKWVDSPHLIAIIL